MDQAVNPTNRPCAGCGRTIIWAKTPNGKNVPLERVPITEVNAEGVAFTSPNETVLVNHFKTCPKASDFSGKGKS